MKRTTAHKGAAICRWTGRIFGVLLAGLIVVLAVGEGMPNLLTQTVKVQIGFLALTLFMAGVLAGWKWELWGGIVSLGGWILFYLAVINSPKAMNWFFMALTLPGMLYVASAFLRRCEKNR